MVDWAREEMILPIWDGDGPWCAYERCKAWEDGRCTYTGATREKGAVAQSCQAVAVALKQKLLEMQREQAEILNEGLRQNTLHRLERCEWTMSKRLDLNSDCGGRFPGCKLIVGSKDTIERFKYCPRCGRPVKYEGAKP